MNVVELRIGRRVYALLIDHVLEVLRMVEVTPLPEGPGAVLGVINLRGKSIAVVNLAERLGVEPPPYHQDTYLVVLEHGDRTMAVPVDEVVGVGHVSPEEIEPPPSAGLTATLVGGVISRDEGQLMVLDPVVLFDSGVADLTRADEPTTAP